MNNAMAHTPSHVCLHTWYGSLNTVMWNTGNITEELVQKYLEHHHNPSNQDTGTMILE